MRLSFLVGRAHIYLVMLQLLASMLGITCASLQPPATAIHLFILAALFFLGRRRSNRWLFSVDLMQPSHSRSGAAASLSLSLSGFFGADPSLRRLMSRARLGTTMRARGEMGEYQHVMSWWNIKSVGSPLGWKLTMWFPIRVHGTSKVAKTGSVNFYRE